VEKIYRAAKYIRTSCPDDESQYRDSIANQRKLIDAFIQAHTEIIVISEKIDDGYSGLFVERPALKELMSEIESGAVNCVVIKDLSRLSRDYIEAGRYIRDYFPAYDVRFISVDDHIDSIRSDGFDKTIALLKSIFSEQYSHDVSVKTRSSLDAKRKQGKYVGAIPIYGYQKSVDDKHQLIPDPNTADVVRSIFCMKIQGMSAAAIASVLNKSGISSPLSYKRKHGISCPAGGYADKSAALWSVTTILRILRDENYTGTLIQGRQRSFSYKIRNIINLDESEWVKIENAHQAIISRADYEAVQRILAIDTRTSPRHDRVHIFSGMLICGCCGSNMMRKCAKYEEQQYIYYYCSTGKNGGCRISGSISEEDLMDIVMQRVKEHIMNIERLNASISETQIKEMMRTELVQQINAGNVKLRDLHRYKLHLRNSKTEGFIDDVEYQELYDFYDDEIACCDSKISALYKELRRADGSIDGDSGWKQSFLQFAYMEKLDREAVVKMIQSICITAAKELIVNFVYQSEYEQLVRYSTPGGCTVGEKKPQTKQ